MGPQQLTSRPHHPQLLFELLQPVLPRLEHLQPLKRNRLPLSALNQSEWDQQGGQSCEPGRQIGVAQQRVSDRSSQAKQLQRSKINNIAPVLCKSLRPGCKVQLSTSMTNSIQIAAALPALLRALPSQSINDPRVSSVRVTMRCCICGCKEISRSLLGPWGGPLAGPLPCAAALLWFAFPAHSINQPAVHAVFG